MPRAEAVTRSDLVEAVQKAVEIIDEALPQSVPVDDPLYRPVAFGLILSELLRYEFVDE